MSLKFRARSKWGCLSLVVALLIWVAASLHKQRKLVQFVQENNNNATKSAVPITCPTMSFPPRSKKDMASKRAQWNKAMDFVASRKLSFIPNQTLEMHFNFISEIEQQGVSGMILETGVAKAGSSITFAAAKHPDRCLHLFDTFQGIPAPSDKDGADVHKRYEVIKSGRAGTDYYGYKQNLLEFDMEQFVEALLSPSKNRVSFHKGLFHDTVFPAGDVAYAHLDGDWYESTYEMLQRIIPWLSAQGGILLLDDVHHYSGARIAYEDFFKVSTKWLGDTHKGDLCEVFTRKSKRYALFKSDRFGARVVVGDKDMPQCEVLASST